MGGFSSSGHQLHLNSHCLLNCLLDASNDDSQSWKLCVSVYQKCWFALKQFDQQQWWNPSLWRKLKGLIKKWSHKRRFWKTAIFEFLRKVRRISCWAAWRSCPQDHSFRKSVVRHNFRLRNGYVSFRAVLLFCLRTSIIWFLYNSILVFYAMSEWMICS